MAYFVCFLLSPNSQMVLKRAVSDPSMKALQCMCFLDKDASEILVAGCQSDMYKVDIDKGIIVKQVWG